MRRQLRLLRYALPHWRALTMIVVTMALAIGLEVLRPWPTKLLVDFLFFHDVLKAENILARRYFYPGCHRMEPYRSLPQYQGLRLPLTEGLCSRVLCLPTGTAINSRDIDTISRVISLAAATAPAIAARLAT